MFHKVHCTLGSFCEHLKIINFLLILFRRNIVVYEIEFGVFLHSHVVINNTSSGVYMKLSRPSSRGVPIPP